MSRHLKIGARGSLLSLTQTTLIKNEIEKRTGATFEIVKIKTQGDQIQDKPLWQLEGKDFFTKELDAALIQKEVDLVVHSYKDLGSERPEGIHLAAITERKYAHDILLIKNETIEKFLKEGTISHIVIGTSSPRRIVNVEARLHEYLPFLNESTKVECKTLRGNVNTRIQKLLDYEDHGYDAIILALAGLERLANHEDSLKELQALTKDLNFTILPQSLFPSAASQGALAIECFEDREDFEEIKSILQSVHCEKTASEMKQERAAFQSYGGGCHLAVGIHNHQINKTQGKYSYQIERGTVDDKVVYKKELIGSHIEASNELTFIGMKESAKFKGNILFDQYIDKKEHDIKINHNGNFFVTSRYCINQIANKELSNSFWSSGMATHKKLLDKGLWINGCADGFGHSEIKNFKESKAIACLLKQSNWFVLTHGQATSEVGEVIDCYERVTKDVSAEFEDKLKQCKRFFWSSYPQYELYMGRFPFLKVNNAQHLCGVGKTLEKMLENGVNVTPVVSIDSLF